MEVVHHQFDDTPSVEVWGPRWKVSVCTTQYLDSGTHFNHDSEVKDLDLDVAEVGGTVLWDPPDALAGNWCVIKL